jgi:hypothetical protein
MAFEGGGSRPPIVSPRASGLSTQIQNKVERYQKKSTEIYITYPTLMRYLIRTSPAQRLRAPNPNSVNLQAVIKRRLKSLSNIL